MMALTDPEIRVLASLIEKEAAVPESYPLTLNSLRLACNQSTNRKPILSYDDRTVEAALLSLKSVGLVRFVHPSHGGRTTRYRHAAGERWRLSPGELLVLSALALRGPQTVAEVRSRIDRLLPGDESATVEEMLDTLAARGPEPLAVHVGRRAGERDDRWAAMLGSSAPDSADEDDTGPLDGIEVGWRDDVEAAAEANPPETSTPNEDVEVLTKRVEDLAATIGAVASRLERLEQRLGVSGLP
jgi:uncharacterized protein YceH (UPF0502 family)